MALSKPCAAVWQRIYYCAKLYVMLRSYDDFCSIICTVLHGRCCVIQHSCCNTNKTIIIIIIYASVRVPEVGDKNCYYYYYKNYYL